MSLPNARYRTYIDETTVIPDDDMNGIQDEIVRAWKMSVGRAFCVKDDFLTATLDTSKWGKSEITGGTVTITTDDQASDGFGSMILTLDADGSTASASITARCPTGTRDMYYEARVRAVTFTSGTLWCGFEGSAASEDLYFHSTDGGNWFCKIGAANTDSGVAFTSTYKRLEIRRESSVATFLIDGVEVHSAAFAANVDYHNIYAGRFTSAAAAGDVRIDYVGAWIDR
jgi:hypothetical protein